MTTFRYKIPPHCNRISLYLHNSLFLTSSNDKPFYDFLFAPNILGYTNTYGNLVLSRFNFTDGDMLKHNELKEFIKCVFVHKALKKKSNF